MLSVRSTSPAAVTSAVHQTVPKLQFGAVHGRLKVCGVPASKLASEPVRQVVFPLLSRPHIETLTGVAAVPILLTVTVSVYVTVL